MAIVSLLVFYFINRLCIFLVALFVVYASNNDFCTQIGQSLSQRWSHLGRLLLTVGSLCVCVCVYVYVYTDGDEWRAHKHMDRRSVNLTSICKCSIKVYTSCLLLSSHYHCYYIMYFIHAFHWNTMLQFLLQAIKEKQNKRNIKIIIISQSYLIISVCVCVCLNVFSCLILSATLSAPYNFNYAFWTMVILATDALHTWSQSIANQNIARQVQCEWLICTHLRNKGITYVMVSIYHCAVALSTIRLCVYIQLIRLHSPFI